MQYNLFIMKKLICLLGAFLCLSFSFSQKIQILDIFTKEKIGGVSLKVKNTDTEKFSNFNGEVEINTSDSVLLTCLGYEPQTLLIHANTKVVHLTPSSFGLDQVVISANRSLQKKSEAPIAISQVSSKQLKKIHALSTDEILNTVPGVYVADLGNEQHNMAIRQPLSYKSLFLYLEDGLPIRTTGLFNHNALLELDLLSFKNVEVIRGPASSLYGSDAIGGAINFITQQPSAVSFGQMGYSLNSDNLKRYDGIYSNQYKNGFSWLISNSYTSRKDGYREHSDFEKNAMSTKFVYPISESVELSAGINYIDYRSDAAGTLDSTQFYGGLYSSVQTFTERAVKSLRAKSNLKISSSVLSETNITLFYRNNSISQNPHYRIKDDFSPWRNPSGNINLAHSEINENAFSSYGALIRHKQDVSPLNLTINSGVNVDYSPSTYIANYITVEKSDSGMYTSFEKTDSLLSSYQTDITNMGIYSQFEYDGIDNLILSVGFRMDLYTYLFKNNLGTSAFSGSEDSNEGFNAFTPKLGLVYFLHPDLNIYTNYSRGFAPPQVTELYRGVKVPYLESAIYDNYEVGLRSLLLNKSAYVDIAIYQMNGKNEIVQIIDEEGNRVNKNAAETVHKGIEYTFNLKLSKHLKAVIGATYAKHYYTQFNDGQNNYSNKEMSLAPRTIANSQLILSPKPHFNLMAEWQHLGNYFMDIDHSKSYAGFDVYNVSMNYTWKSYHFNLGIKNVLDSKYATIATKSRWGSSYHPANPRLFKLGIKLDIF